MCGQRKADPRRGAPRRSPSKKVSARDIKSNLYKCARISLLPSSKYKGLSLYIKIRKILPILIAHPGSLILLLPHQLPA